MEKIFFTKMQGLGNDFVILDWEEFQEINEPIDKLAVKMCDRNFGVGADGLIVVVPDSQKADLSWIFYNSDGTPAQMCGNGMRCFAKYVLNKGYIDKHEFSVDTKAGIISPKINEDGTVTVNMGKPILEPAKIPFKGEYNLNYEIELWAKKFKLNCVSMGNPHCVIFTDENIKTMALDYGPDIEKHELFPEKTNVEFINIKSANEIDLAVWERGCGITLACGTGACASVVAGILNGYLENKVKVNLPGGSLNIEWHGSKNDPSMDVFMTGEASFSFEGVFYNKKC